MEKSPYDKHRFSNQKVRNMGSPVTPSIIVDKCININTVMDNHNSRLYDYENSFENDKDNIREPNIFQIILFSILNGMFIGLVVSVIKQFQSRLYVVLTKTLAQDYIIGEKGIGGWYLGLQVTIIVSIVGLFSSYITEFYIPECVGSGLVALRISLIKYSSRISTEMAEMKVKRKSEVKYRQACNGNNQDYTYRNSETDNGIREHHQTISDTQIENVKYKEHSINLNGLKQSNNFHGNANKKQDTIDDTYNKQNNNIVKQYSKDLIHSNKKKKYQISFCRILLTILYIGSGNCLGIEAPILHISYGISVSLLDWFFIPLKEFKKHLIEKNEEKSHFIFIFRFFSRNKIKWKKYFNELNCKCKGLYSLFRIIFRKEKEKEKENVNSQFSKRIYSFNERMRSPISESVSYDTPSAIALTPLASSSPVTYRTDISIVSMHNNNTIDSRTCSHSKTTSIDQLRLLMILAGGSAGLASAFNAPFTGIIFCIEEFSKEMQLIEMKHKLIIVIITVIISTFTARLITSDGELFRISQEFQDYGLQCFSNYCSSNDDNYTDIITVPIVEINRNGTPYIWHMFSFMWLGISIVIGFIGSCICIPIQKSILILRGYINNNNNNKFRRNPKWTKVSYCFFSSLFTGLIGWLIWAIANHQSVNIRSVYISPIWGPGEDYIQTILLDSRVPIESSYNRDGFFPLEKLAIDQRLIEINRNDFIYINKEFPVSDIVISLIGRIIVTIFSVASGGCGGIFQPSLVIGIGIGSLIRSICLNFIRHPHLDFLFILGMSSCFSSLLHLPITAVVLIYEVTNFSVFASPFMLPLILCSFTSWGITEMFCSDLYDSMIENDGNKILLLSQFRNREEDVEEL